MTSVPDAPAMRFTVGGDPGLQIADPSIFETALAYSSIPANGANKPDQGGISTHVAVTTNAGASWTSVAEINHAAVLPSSPACMSSAGCSIHVVNETPSLVHDAADPDPARRWKVFTHRYLVLEKTGADPVLLYTQGHIAMFTGADPAGPWNVDAEVAVGWPGSDISTMGAKYLPSASPGTMACGAFGEPGATIAPDGSLHLALGCIVPPFEDPRIDVVLLRSTDHGATFGYVSTPLRGEDGACWGGAGKRMNAVDLFTASGTEYLMATPEGPQVRAGCVVTPFDDATTGHLRRAAGGAIAPSRVLVPTFDPAEIVHYAGACTYGAATPQAGYTMSHLRVETGKLPAIHEIATGVAGP